MGSSANFLSEKELNALRNQAYDGYIRIPTTATRAGKSGQKVEYKQRGGGEIDYSAYGGKSKYLSPFLSQAWSRQIRGGQPTGTLERVENWGKVAKHLGIKNVDSEDDLRQMYDYVLHGSRENAAEKEPDDDPVTEQPVTPFGEGDKELADAREKFDKTRPWAEGMDQPKLDPHGNPYEDAINHGNDLNAHYEKKFLPSLFNEAYLGAQEIGKVGRFHLKNFVGKVPELGDPKELFKYYKDQIG